jgi:hypothetical protein
VSGARIIFVPGMKPKPPPDVHRRELLRVMLAGLARTRPEAARRLAASFDCFSLVGWTFAFYGTHRAIELDLPGIDRLLERPLPTPEELREIGAWPRTLLRHWHVLGDRLPWLGRYIAQPAMRLTMLEAGRYLGDRDGIGSATRALLADVLDRAWRAGERVLLIGHSLGSVIAYDALWELSRGSQARAGTVDLFVTLGSPLATRFVRHALRGAHEHGATRYPANIRRWVNFAARGDITALYPQLAPVFVEMVARGLVESIQDHVDLDNHFRGPLGLNVHEAYGYLVHARVADTIGAWLEQA